MNDVVMLMEEKIPRLNWKIGTIQEVCRGRDNCIRSAVVIVRSGDRYVRLRRPIRLLVPIEKGSDEV